MAAKIEEILASLLLPADSDWQVESFEKNRIGEKMGNYDVIQRFFGG